MRKPVVKYLFGGPETKPSFLVILIFLNKMTDWSSRRGETPQKTLLLLLASCCYCRFLVCLRVSDSSPWLGRRPGMW